MERRIHSFDVLYMDGLEEWNSVEEVFPLYGQTRYVQRTHAHTHTYIQHKAQQKPTQ